MGEFIRPKVVTTAGVVIVMAVTPTLVDFYQAWNDRPELRPFLIGWYIFTIYVALAAWRMFA